MKKKLISGIAMGGTAALGIMFSGCQSKPSILQPRADVSDPYALSSKKEVAKVDHSRKKDNSFDFLNEQPPPPKRVKKKKQPELIFEDKEIGKKNDFDIDVPDLDLPDKTSSLPEKQPPPPPETHKVKKGDTLWGISRMWSVSVDELCAVNNISKTDTLRVGQKLEIPRGGFLTKADKNIKTTDNASYYTVKRGDTLSGIAKRSGMSVKELKLLNNLNSDVIRIGQKLALKEGVKLESTTPVPSKVVLNANGEYVVQPGDSLWKIANIHKMKVSDLKAVNGLTSNNLKVGQKLKVTGNAPSTNVSFNNGGGTDVSPAPSGQAVKHTVQAGDSLWSLSKKYGVKISDIQKANNMKGTYIIPGKTLIIVPGKDIGGGKLADNDTNVNKGNNPEGPGVDPDLPKPDAPKPAGGKKVILPHFVESTESLKSIAEMYDSKVEWIIEANPNVKSDEDLKKVSEIKVPVEEIELRGG